MDFFYLGQTKELIFSTTPNTGILTASNIFAAFLASARATFCGVVTMTHPEIENVYVYPLYNFKLQHFKYFWFRSNKTFEISFTKILGSKFMLSEFKISQLFKYIFCFNLTGVSYNIVKNATVKPAITMLHQKKLTTFCYQLH